MEVFLQTPLFRFKYLYDKEERELMENIVRISGLLLKETQLGVLIQVKAISNLKVVEKELPFETIFIPMNKVDFIVVKQ